MCPAPEDARTASATSTRSAFFAASSIGAVSSIRVRASIVNVTGGTFARLRISPSTRASGFETSAKSLITTITTRDSGRSGRTPASSRTSVIARWAISAATRRLSSESTARKIASAPWAASTSAWNLS